MADLLKGGAVFIHIPKCGGTFVREALRKLGLFHSRVGFKHSTPERINDIWKFHRGKYLKRWIARPWLTPGALRRAPKFTFIRNPLSWYESWWKFMAGHWTIWEPGRWHPQRVIECCADDDFNGFVKKILDHQPGYVTRMYADYTQGVQFVGRTENLCDDLIAALRQCGETFDEQAVRSTPRVNESKPRCGEPVWDSALMQKVIDSESAGIERFGYAEQVKKFAASRGAGKVAVMCMSAVGPAVALFDSCSDVLIDLVT